MSRTLKIAGITSTMLLVIFLLTSPRDLPSIMLVVPFLLLFMLLALAARALLGHYGIGGPKRLRIALVAAAAPVLLLVLQSLGQLTIRDVLAISILFGVGYFYVSRFGLQAAR